MRYLLALALLGTPAAAGELESRIRLADRRVAGRFLTLAVGAEKAKQHATAARLFERVLALDPGHATARRHLGYTKKKDGTWRRESAGFARVARARNTDPVRVERLRADRLKLEETRAKEILRLLKKYGTPDTARPHLMALLTFVPRSDSVHATLGHPTIGGRRVRPELAALARALPDRRAAWEACRTPAHAYATKETLSFRGLREPKPVIRVGARRIATGYKRSNTIYLARRTECAHQLMRQLLGEKAQLWDRSPVYFLYKNQFEAFINWRYRDATVRRRVLRFSTHDGGDFVAFRTTMKYGLDLYTHSAGFWTIQELASPLRADETIDFDTYSWLKEGFALLLTLELYDSADSWFTSRTESTGKAPPTLPLPETRTHTACLQYVRGQLYDGALPPLREVLGNSLNNLDRFRALQAWTFVRFLALLDADGFRRLPAALQAETAGPQVERSERALAKAFDRDAGTLIRLWRAYLLELT